MEADACGQGGSAYRPLVQCCCQRYAGSMDFADEVSRGKGPPLTECRPLPTLCEEIA
jgi:hypothetical protein